MGTEPRIPVAMMDCPDCDGRGWDTEVESAHGCDGTPEGCAATCPVPVQVQVQCEYCGGSGEVEVPV